MGGPQAGGVCQGCYEYDTRSSGTASLAYDAAGALTSDGDKLYEYDALGRLTYAASNANTNVELARYAYDALGRLAMQITYDYRQDAADPYDQLNTTRYFYYDTPDVGGASPASASDHPILPQVIEQRDGDGDVTDQFIWGPAYVDELLTHDRDTDGDGGVDQRLYATHDRLYSVLSLVDEDGQAIEHYEYSPYGADPLDPRTGFAAITDAATGLPLSPELAAGEYLYTGRRYDAVIGFNNHRRRPLSHNLGRWVQQDPLGVAIMAQPSATDEREATRATVMAMAVASGGSLEGLATVLQTNEPALGMYRDGPNLYEYVGSGPTAGVDPTGLARSRTHMTCGGSHFCDLYNLWPPLGRVRVTPNDAGPCETACCWAHELTHVAQIGGCCFRAKIMYHTYLDLWERGDLAGRVVADYADWRGQNDDWHECLAHKAHAACLRSMAQDTRCHDEPLCGLAHIVEKEIQREGYCRKAVSTPCPSFIYEGTPGN